MDAKTNSNSFSFWETDLADIDYSKIEKNFLSFYNLLTDLCMIAILTPKGELNYKWAFRGETFLGYTAKEINDSLWLNNSVNKEDFDHFRKYLKELILGKSGMIQINVKDINSDSKVLRGYGAPILSKESKVIGGIVGFLDITDCSEPGMYQNLSVDNPLTSILANNFILDEQGKIVSCTESAITTLGLDSANDYSGNSFIELFSSDSRQEISNLLESSEHVVIEAKLAEYGHWVEISSYPIKEVGYKVNKFLLIRDISDKHKAKQILIESEAKFRVLAEATPEMIVVLRDKEKIYLNSKWETKLGYPLKEIYSNDFLLKDLLPSDESDRIYNEIEQERIAQGFSQKKIKVKTVSGSYIDCILTIKNIELEGNEAVIGVLTDISEISKTTEILTETKKRYWSLFEASPDAIFLETFDGVVLDCNKRAEEIYRYSRKELLGMKAIDLMPGSQAETLIETTHILREKKEDVIVETYGLRKDGTTFPAEVTINRTVLSNEDCFVVMARDISSRRENEIARQRYEAQVHQLQKLESLGTMANGLANDFNNLLTGIMGYADLLQRSHHGDSSSKEKYEKIIEAARKAGEIIQQLMAYAGKGQVNFQPVSLTDLVNEMRHLIHASVSKASKLKMEIEANLLPVKLDSAQIRQAIINLIKNASEALNSGAGNISLKVCAGNKSFNGDEDGYFGPAFQKGEYQAIIVADDGCGIDEKQLDSIFDPFYTTKFSGRGLGLTALLSTVRSHKGAIKISSAPDTGTEFLILLPIEKLEGKVKISLASELKRKKGAALIVEDEETVREVEALFLEDIGFKTYTAVNGREGLEKFQLLNEELSFILLDLSMPEMDGLELLREIRWLNSTIPVVLCTGLLNSDDRKRLEGLGVQNIIQKPFEFDELKEIIRGLNLNVKI